MAYMSQATKKELAPGIKAVLKKHGFVGSIGVKHHSTLVVNVRKGKLALPERYAEDGYFTANFTPTSEMSPEWGAFVEELRTAMNHGNHDRSDIMTDYFDVGWYININIGNWGKPYEVA